MSQESSDAILAVLTRHYTTVGVTIVNDLSDLKALVALQPDLVFLGMKFVPLDPTLGRHGPKIWPADYLETHGIAYTGSGQQAHELELDKQLAKQRVLDAGLQTAAFQVVHQGTTLVRSKLHLGFPLFVKPTSCSGGFGVDEASVVNNFHELQAKVRSIAANQKSDALIEEYLPGREFSVAILRDELSGELAVMPMEMVAPPDEHGHRLLSGAVKSANVERVLVLTDASIKSKVTALALGVFRVLGARDYGRIDIRLDAAGQPQFLEANLLPSLISGYGSFPKACLMNIGLDYEQMVLTIARLGLARQTDLDDDITDIHETGMLPTLEAAV